MKDDAQLKVRSYNEADIDQLIDIQNECFHFPYPVWTKEQILSHIACFSEGALCVEADGGQIVGSGTAVIKKYELHKEPSDTVKDISYGWEHEPAGNALYGVDLAVRPSWRRMGVAKLLYQARFKLIRTRNLECFFCVSRIPGYSSYRDTMTPELYVENVVAGKIVDPVVTPYVKLGLKPRRVFSNFVLDDESVNFGVLTQWLNPDYKSSL